MRIRSRILVLLCHFDADPDPICYFDVNPDPSFHFDADPDPTFHQPLTFMRIRIQILASKWRYKTSKKSVLIGSYGIPYILTRHLQIDADPDSDPAYHIDADPNHTFQFDADPCGSESATLGYGIGTVRYH